MRAATCTTTGLQERYCDGCGNRETSNISALGHNLEYNIEISAATCEQPGTLADKCRTCGAEQNVRTIPATGHYANGGTEETFALQDAETGVWARMTYECANENGYIADLKWVSFCADCENRGTLYCEGEHVHNLVEEESNNVYHCANADDYIHYYREIRDEAGELITTLWIGTHQCLTCDYVFTSTLLSEHAVRRQEGTDVWYCDTCNEEVTGQAAPEDFPINWCYICEHTWTVWEEAETGDMLETEHRKEQRHCLLDECGLTEERDIHEEGWDYAVLTQENGVCRKVEYYCRDTQTTLPDNAFVAKICAVCEMNQVITPMGTRTPISQCTVTTEEEAWDSPESGATVMVTHVCSPELVHLYNEPEEGENPTIMTAAGRQCICCGEVREVEKHVMTPLDADRTMWHCSTCNKAVEAMNDMGGDMYRDWCSLYSHNYVTEHAYISYQGSEELRVLGAMRTYCTLCREQEEPVQHTLTPGGEAEGRFYCTECAQEVEAFNDSDHTFVSDWCALTGEHHWQEVEETISLSFDCEDSTWTVECWACSETDEISLTEDNIPENCSDSTKEVLLEILALEGHDSVWLIEYTTEDGMPYSEELSPTVTSVFTEEELAGATLTESCHRAAPSPFSGNCMYTETYTASTEIPITEFFEYSEDIGGYVFVGSTE